MDEISVSWEKIADEIDKRIELMKPAIESKLRKHISDDIIFNIELMREGLVEDIRKIVREQLKDLRKGSEPRKIIVRPFNWDTPGEYEEEMFMKMERSIIGWYEHPRRIRQITDSDFPEMFRSEQIGQATSVGLDFSGSHDSPGKERRTRFMKMLVEREGARVEWRQYYQKTRTKAIDYWIPRDREEWMDGAIVTLDSLVD